jgi:hypothetical protein
MNVETQLHGAFTDSVRTSQETQHVRIATTNRSTRFSQTIANGKNHTKHINTLCGPNAGGLNEKKKQEVRIVTTVL